MLALTGARIFDGEAWLERHAVVVENGVIRAVLAEAELGDRIERRHLGGGVLAPGFIDVQVNGGGGALLNADPTPATVARIAEAHRVYGTTGLLPTVITDAPDVLARAIAAVRVARHEAPAVLGIHIEGPFIDVARKGAHDASFIRAMTAQDVEMIAAADCGAVMLTLAPNRVAPSLIAALAKRGVVVSLGHADATCAEAQAALGAGARAFTHLYNAMSQLTGRAPGVVGAALADPESFVGIIADGHHVDDDALRVAFAAKPRDRVMLISDAMPTAAGGPDSFDLQGRRVMRRAGRLSLEDGTLAGSDLTMDAALRYCVQRLKIDLGQALVMASRNPAALLRRSHDLGQIAPGYLANLVHLGDDLRVIGTWVGGK